MIERLHRWYKQGRLQAHKTVELARALQAEGLEFAPDDLNKLRQYFSKIHPKYQDDIEAYTFVILVLGPHEEIVHSATVIKKLKQLEKRKLI